MANMLFVSINLSLEKGFCEIFLFEFIMLCNIRAFLSDKGLIGSQVLNVRKRSVLSF